MWRRILFSTLAGAAAISLLLSAAAEKATAGTYPVYQCDPGSATHIGVPDLENHPSTFGSTAGYHGFTTCHATHGAHVFAWSPGDGGGPCTTRSVPYLTNGFIRFAAPAALAFVGGSFNWSYSSACGNHPYWRYRAADGSLLQSGDTGDAQGGKFLTGEGKFLDVGIICFDAAGCNAYGPYGLSGVKTVSFTLDDRSLPAAPALSGSLVDPGPRRGTESLVVGASDVGGGVAEVEVLVNGAVIRDQAVAGCQALPSNSMIPCPLQTMESFSIPTDAAPFHDGRNTLEVCAVDIAQGAQGGNRSNPCAKLVVEVDNSCDESLGPDAASSLEAGLAQGPAEPKPSLQVLSTQGAAIKGRIANSSGNGISSGTICIYEQVAAADEHKALVRTVPSRSNGGFQADVPAGPSRSIYVTYRRGNRLLEKQLELISKAKPTFSIRKRRLQNGKVMRFGGCIPGPHNAKRAIAVQARVGRIWRTFKELVTNDGGCFRGRYRFKSSTAPLTKYTFRVLVKAQNGYPYLAGTSRKRKVIVTG